MDIFEQMKNRYRSTPPPAPTQEITKDNEKLTQWYLEHSFFRDFVYRNPDKKPGKEFSDALIVYDDTIIIIQNKTQSSSRLNVDWAEKNLNEAIGQLNGSYRNIDKGLVTKFKNVFLNTEISIDKSKHKFIYGIIVLAQEGEPYNPYPLIHEKMRPRYPYTVCSLNDLFIIADRMDTAADFITYFELRIDTLRQGKELLVNDEISNMNTVAEFLPIILKEHLNSLAPEKQEKTIKLKKDQLTTRLKDREEYKYSLLIDDIIARAHDKDPKYTDTVNNEGNKISEIYGYLDRFRRINIGRKLLEAAIKSKTNNDKIIVHIQKPIKQVFIYLFTKLNRDDRREYLKILSVIAQKKYSLQKILSMATEPIGMGGRSYDFLYLEKIMLKEGVDIPAAIWNDLPEITGL